MEEGEGGRGKEEEEAVAYRQVFYIREREEVVETAITASSGGGWKICGFKEEVKFIIGGRRRCRSESGSLNRD